MSRVSLIEKLYVKRKSAMEFDYDALTAPPILSILSIQDINELYKIATSVKYNGNMDKKYELIDAIMTRRGFRKAHCGTNRVVYHFLELPTFVAKVALDRVGITDSPAEYKNQAFFKPFCCKIFEVDPSGTVAFVERVNPISSKEEFLSVADDIFNLLITKVIGKYVVDDLGSDTYMNFGVRQLSGGCTFGPVIIDFPYAYELDGAKLICAKEINSPQGKMRCGGEIDYDAGFNHLVCCRCGKTYTAMDLKKENNGVIMFGKAKEVLGMRTKVISGDQVILDSGRSSDTYVSKNDYDEMTKGHLEPNKEYVVGRTVKKKYKPAQQKRRDYYTQLQREHFQEVQKAEASLLRVSVPVDDISHNDKFDHKIEENESTGIPMIVAMTVESNTRDIESKVLPEVYQAEVATHHEENVVSEQEADNTPPITEEVTNDHKPYMEVAEGEVLSPELQAFVETFDIELRKNLDTVIPSKTESEEPDDTDGEIVGTEDAVNEEQSTEEETNAEYLATQAAELANTMMNGISDAVEIADNDRSEKTEPETQLIIGSEATSEETDYSNYVPPEENDTEDESTEENNKYKDEIEKFEASQGGKNKSKKKNGQGKKPSARNIRKHASRYEGYGEEDMSEY